MLVVEPKNVPPSYAEKARRAVMNPKNWERLFALAVAFAGTGRRQPEQ
jgi:hypothetical protein